MVFANKKTGDDGETAVVAFLIARQFEVLARNWRHGRDEIDIVARHEDLLVLVEVRTRAVGARVSGLQSIDAKKRASLRRSAHAFMKHALYQYVGVTRLRIDVASVVFGPYGPEIRYAEGALSD